MLCGLPVKFVQERNAKDNRPTVKENGIETGSKEKEWLKIIMWN